MRLINPTWISDELKEELECSSAFLNPTNEHFFTLRVYSDADVSEYLIPADIVLKSASDDALVHDIVEALMPSGMGLGEK